MRACFDPNLAPTIKSMFRLLFMHVSMAQPAPDGGDRSAVRPSNFDRVVDATIATGVDGCHYGPPRNISGSVDLWSGDIGSPVSGNDRKVGERLI